MGVPKFYRFVSERYPLINTKLQQGVAPAIDYLYLDMNGIIHNCTRATPGNGGIDTRRYSETLPMAKSEDAIFLDVFKYIDNLVAMVPPRKLLYMAIDGVAPRAKMNQQRSRRFRSAKERLDEHNRRVEEDPMYAAAQLEPFDSNCITPGTPFMQRLTEVLKYYVAKKISEDSLWSNISVILSGAETPGEGEHKIMEYIRAVRETGKLSPNTRHCVYGLDADLIMLGLVTHEPHFFLLREKVDFGAYWRKKGGPRIATSLDTTVFGQFELLSIGVLREYLVLELGADGNSELPFFEVERIADDFVFILMLIGNDFLPHLPMLDIADGTLHVLLHLYKRLLPILGGYLTEEGKICPERLEYFLAKLGMLEKRVLRHRLEMEESAKQNRGARRGAKNTALSNVDLDDVFALKKLNGTIVHAALSSKAMIQEARACRELVNDTELLDMKRRYYSQKLEMKSDDYRDNELKVLCRSYVQGIMWTLKYYTEGCQYWRWFYPYHYAPFASDITDLVVEVAAAEKGFVKDKPFRPFDQLVSVLPPISSWCLPKPFQWLMTNPSSPICDQFPDNFETDMNGKRNDWEAVVLLPFVDETRLLKAIDGIPDRNLIHSELQRNIHGPAHVYKLDDSGHEEMLPSPFGSRMPSFMNRTKCTQLVLPKLEHGHPFKARVLSGTQKPSLQSDLPSLSFLLHQSRLDRIGVNIFGSPSKSESVVLVMNRKGDKDGSKPRENGLQTEKIPDLESRGVSVHSAVWFGYPWQRAGHVNIICDESQTKSRDQASQAHEIKSRSTDKNAFNSERAVVLSALSVKNGIEIESPSTLVSVEAEIEQATGAKEDDSASGTYVSQFVHSRKVQHKQVQGDETTNVNIGQSVMYIGHGAYHGHVGKVVPNLRSQDMVRVQFDWPVSAAREPAFGYRVVSLAGSQRWMTINRLAHSVGMSVAVVDAFLGSVRVRLSSSKDEMDVGLGIKYVSRGLCIPGYARKDERDTFLFSEKSASMLTHYQSAFPDLFKAVEKLRMDEANSGGGRGRGNAVYSSKEVFGKSKKSDEAAKAASTWLSVQEIAGLPLVSANASVLSKETTGELEKHRDIAISLQKEYRSSLGKVDGQRITKEVVSGQLLVGTEGTMATSHRALNRPQGIGLVSADGQGIRLGDRVANRIAQGGIPFGLRGTVVGIHKQEKEAGSALIEVVFDEGFIGGGELNGRCNHGRGKAIEADRVVILRPDRENQYYTRNYARVAAQLTQANRGRTGQKVASKQDAVSEAAVASYADAVRGKAEGKANGATTVAKNETVTLPLPTFAAGKRGRKSNAKTNESEGKGERDREAEELSRMLKKELGIGWENGGGDGQTTPDVWVEGAVDSDFDALWKCLETEYRRGRA